MRDRNRGVACSIAAALSFFLTVSAFVSCAGAPSAMNIPAIATFNGELFAGKWYEIARIPIPVARDWVGTSDTYLAQKDGTWTVLYEGYKGGFDGQKGLMKQKLKIKDPKVAGEMLASPFPLVWLPYRLVYWNEADLTMLVTSGTMDYLWVMAKDPVPATAAYDAAVRRAGELGFDLARLEKVPQRP